MAPLKEKLCGLSLYRLVMRRYEDHVVRKGSGMFNVDRYRRDDHRNVGIMYLLCQSRYDFIIFPMMMMADI